MDRRKFLLASSLVAGGSLVGSAAAATPDSIKASLPLIKPKRLSKGDTIGLITPASAISRSSFDAALDNIEALGFKAKYSDNIRVKKGFLGGTDEQRIEDLHTMFGDDSIDGIVCARGGYGSGRLLPDLDYDMIRSNPKVLIGYSDITALLYGIHKHTGLVCFHGPVGASDFSDFTTEQFERVLMQSKNKTIIKRPKAWGKYTDEVYEAHTIVSGEASGALVGGNFSLMLSLIGTPYDIDFEGKIVFIEEIGEATYRVDRMLTQLVQSGKLDNAKGIAMGVFKGCDTNEEALDFGQSTSIREMLMDRLGHLNIPVAYGLPIGHIADNATLPIGIEATLNADKISLTLNDSGVV